jgi:hypothetical protein
MPPRVWLHVSKLPRLLAAGGLPALALAQGLAEGAIASYNPVRLPKLLVVAA